MPLAGLIDPDYLKKRFEEHWAYATDFVEKYNNKHSCQLAVDSSALFLAMKSAYDDVERYKKYHHENPQVQKSNSVKRAAYLVKWVVRCVPIRSTRIGSDNPASLPAVEYLANTIFAIGLIRKHLEAEIRTPFAFSDKKVFKLAYDLMFRELSGDALLAMVQDYHDELSGASIVVRK